LIFIVGPAGLEPATPWLWASYEGFQGFVQICICLYQIILNQNNCERLQGFVPIWWKYWHQNWHSFFSEYFSDLKYLWLFLYPPKGIVFICYIDLAKFLFNPISLLCNLACHRPLFKFKQIVIKSIKTWQQIKTPRAVL